MNPFNCQTHQDRPVSRTHVRWCSHECAIEYNSSTPLAKQLADHAEYADALRHSPAPAPAPTRPANEEVGLFLAARCVSDASAWVTRSSMYAAYCDWATASAMRNTALYRELGAAGVRQAGRKGVRGFKGQRLV